MIIKYATKEDIAAIAAVEAECFPPAEAATEKELIDRVKYYGNHFWLMYAVSYTHLTLPTISSV